MKGPTSQGISYEDSKKNDAPIDQPEQQQGGMLWRLGSGVYNTTTGAVGLGFNAAKYVAQTSYGVASKTAEVGVSATKVVATGGYNVVTGSVSAVASRIPGTTYSKQKDKKE